jgi:14-3-3 protein epsilon
VKDTTVIIVAKLTDVEMVDYTKQFAKMSKQELTLDERNILSVAFKNIVGTRRAAWRVLSSIQKKENNKGNTDNVTKVKTYKAAIEKEMTDICQDILDLLTDFLIPNANAGEGKVFFFKMKADYFRYIAEYSSGDKKNQAAQKALQAYNDAGAVAKESLSPTHPVKLGLALNHSVFYYEIMQNPEKAC